MQALEKVSVLKKFHYPRHGFTPQHQTDVVSIFRQFGGKFKVGSNYG